ncbi:MAG: hypothetical protein WDN26_05315 [Chitinophagaceae bacterium]
MSSRIIFFYGSTIIKLVPMPGDTLRGGLMTADTLQGVGTENRDNENQAKLS